MFVMAYTVIAKRWEHGWELEPQEVAKAARNLVNQPRQAGLSVADTAAVLGITKGRVSQLVSH
jgi:hypothetical protein